MIRLETHVESKGECALDRVIETIASKLYVPQFEVTADDAKREEMPEESRWCMIQTGGSIGEERFMNARYGNKRCKVVRDNMTEEEAKDVTKRWNKMLTPGEKKYYRIKYSAVKADKVKMDE